VDADVGSAGEVGRIPVGRLVRDVEVTDQVRREPQRLADRLGPFGEEQALPLPDGAAGQ
jgi:hypothetical protein